TLTENNAQAALNAAQEAKLPVTGSKIVAQGSTYSITLELGEGADPQAVIDEVKKKVDFVNWNVSTSANAITWTLPSNVQTVMKNQAVE
ncbi:hypothetical protein J0675_25075, partial [Vibrio parahaemolyticus]